MAGLFITMEGPDGSGKSSQIELLKAFFEGKGYEVVLTREPGGTKISEAIREVILDKTYTEMSYMTEALLYAAARAQLIDEFIAPAIASGKVVICDRFVDSSAVYQGMARGLGVEKVYALNAYAIRDIMPDLTIHLDLPAEVGLARAKGRAALDRMELESVEFHQKVAQGYRDLAKLDPKRIHTVNADQTIEKVHEDVLKVVEKWFADRKGE